MSTETGITAEVRELAGKTAAEIRRRGLTKGTLGSTIPPVALATCKVCPLGGIAAAAYGDPFKGYELRGAARDLASAYADRVHPGWDVAYGGPSGPGVIDHLYVTVYAHNDEEDTTADDVLAVFDTIAAGR